MFVFISYLTKISEAPSIDVNVKYIADFKIINFRVRSTLLEKVDKEQGHFSITDAKTSPG